MANEQKNGTIKTREVERYKIGESLQSNARMWLNALGYKDVADHYLKLLFRLKYKSTQIILKLRL